jgi:hypothetical protein
MQLFSKEWWSNLFAAQAEAEGTPLVAQIDQLAPARTVRISAEPLATIEAAAAPLIPQAAATSDPRDAELAQLRESIARQEQAATQTKAEAFADGAIRSSQALPAERATLIRMYVAAATDDARDPWPAPASAAEAASRVALLESQIAARPPHTLASEQVRVGDGGVLETKDARAPMTAERRAKLLGMTPLGQAALNQKAKSA